MGQTISKPWRKLAAKARIIQSRIVYNAWWQNTDLVEVYLRNEVGEHWIVVYCTWTHGREVER